MNPLFIKILRWMMQAKVWRFMGFVSAIVGLVCYGLSSSFNHLFGNWNLFKIILYTVLSFIICFLILYAKTWDQSSIVRFEAQFTFLVLTITSVYSFFSDKVMNGKPDTYSLTSCVAFAIMSLSLSRQTQCGFQVDLLYFFLGCLIVQLMKIKLQLGIVGVGFSYSLIILRSSFTSIDVGLENDCPPGGLQDENLVVLVVDSPEISSVSSLMEQLRTYANAAEVDNWKSKVIEYFEDDSGSLSFMSILEGKVMNNEPTEKVQETAKLMISIGFEKECSEVYISCRRECLDDFLQKVIINNSSIQDIHKMTWNDLKKQIGRWTKASKVAFNRLFPRERELSDFVFLGFSTAADLAFTEICRGYTLQLLNFADAVAIGSRAPERLFRIIDMFETLRDLIPEFESLFCDQYSVSLRNEAITIWKRLGEAIRSIFMELELLVCQDQMKKEIAGGGLHPITRYVMNYLSIACDHLQTLELVFEDSVQPLKEFGDRVTSPSPVSFQMGRIIEVFETNLVEKSKIYRDPALCYVFLMNNTRYMVQKIKDSELRALLGDEIIEKYTAKVWQHNEDYQKCSWDKVLGFLKLDSNGSMPLPPKGVRKSMKEKLKSFNMGFEEICRVQSSWFILDEELGEEVITSIKKILLPAYGNFVAKFRSIPELSKHGGKYIRYETEEIEARLNDLFEGRGGSSSSTR